MGFLCFSVKCSESEIESAGLTMAWLSNLEVSSALIMFSKKVSTGNPSKWQLMT